MQWKLLQAGAVPFRFAGTAPQFLLVTSRRGNWIFPKGVVEPGETPEDTVLKEAEEEAGILGTVVPGTVGHYADRKDWSECEVRMYLLECTGDSPRWHESGNRARRWCTFDEALDLLKKSELRAILTRARERVVERRERAAGREVGPRDASTTP